MASLGRVDVGTYKILLVCEEPYPMYQVCGRLFAVWEPDGTSNTVDTNVGAYSTVCVRAVEEHCSRRRTGYGPGIMV